MGQIRIPVGISDFEKISTNQYYYVDKSGLIAELLKEESAEVRLITRPRRLGSVTVQRGWSAKTKPCTAKYHAVHGFLGFSSRPPSYSRIVRSR